MEPALTNAEHNARRDVLKTGGYDEPLSIESETAVSAVVTPLRWERSGDGGRSIHDEGGSSARDGSQDPGEALQVREDEGSESGGEASKEVNQSLARIEMNSLEVKLFLDSIDQRISRMEPRLEEMRSAEAGSTPLETQAKASAGAEEEPLMPVTELPSIVEEVSAPGPTAERRRRAQGVPEERRRSPHAVPLGVPEEVSWDMAHVVNFIRRRWIPIAAIALLTLIMLVFLGSGSRSQQRDAVNRVGTGQIAAVAAPAKPKNSADVPWAGTEVERGGLGRSDTSGAGQAAVAGHSVVIEQGVVVPQSMTAAPAPASAQSKLAMPAVAAVEPAEAGTDSQAGVASVFSNGILTHEDATTEATSASTAATAAPGNLGTAGRIVAPASRRINVSSGVMAGNLLYSPRPAYPKGFATLFHPEGEVVMQAIISKRGKVANLHVISGHYMLRGAAKDAVRTWRYRPYTVNGTPVEVATIVSVEFHR